MQIVSLQSAFHPSWAGSSDRRCPWIGGAAVHSKLPCEDAALLCSLPRSQTKSPSVVSVCCSLSRLTAQLPPHRKNLRFFLSASLVCNTLHLAGKERVPAVPSGLPKSGTSACEKSCACSPANSFSAPYSPLGKDQNHCVPCFTDRIASSAFAFFAVLSLTPAYAILSIISL